MKKHIPVIMTAVLLYGYFSYFTMRYTLAFPPGQSACLYTSFFLVDKWDTNIKEGDLAYFVMNVENEFYPTGLRWIKKVGAMPHSVVDIKSNQVVVNNSTIYPLDMTHIINSLDISGNSIGSIEDFTKTINLSADEVFMIGETINSFDGRFWGALNKQQIKGKAYAIF